MGKRERRRRRSQGHGLPPDDVATAEYVDPEGGVLTLRRSLSVGTIAKIREPPPGSAASREDAWRRRSEMLFERLAVRWEIAGLAMTDQAMLLGRYRLADGETQAWVRRTIDEHLERHIPELR